MVHLAIGVFSFFGSTNIPRIGNQLDGIKEWKENYADSDYLEWITQFLTPRFRIQSGNQRGMHDWLR